MQGGSVAVAQSFQEYVARRRSEMVQRSRHHHGWGLLLGAFAVYVGLCSLLAMRPKEILFSHAWVVTTVPLTLIGVGLYLFGAYLLSLSRQREDLRCHGMWRLSWVRAIRQSISLPYLAIAASIWLGLGIWGEMVSPLLIRQGPQLSAGVVISLILAGSQWWSVAHTFWWVEIQQVWFEYLQDLRQSWLLPHYQHLEDSRACFLRFQRVHDDLGLEEIEAYYLSDLLGSQLQWIHAGQGLPIYAQQIAQARHQLSQLLYQLQQGIEILEDALSQVELVLDHATGPGEGRGLVNWLDQDPDSLHWEEIHTVLRLGESLLTAERSVQGVTHEMQQLISQHDPEHMVGACQTQRGH